jgi:hypothetical protein
MEQKASRTWAIVYYCLFYFVRLFDVLEVFVFFTTVYRLAICGVSFRVERAFFHRKK